MNRIDENPEKTGCGCPLCGGELVKIKEELACVFDGDYFTPPEYDIDYAIFRCEECDTQFKFENSITYSPRYMAILKKRLC